MEAQFDRYGERYEELVERSIHFSGADHAFFVEAKARHLLDLARRRLGDPARLSVVDVGCGVGMMHRYLGSVRSLHGADVSESMIERARRDNPGVEYVVADALHLPYPDRSFDLVFAVGLLHHLAPADRDAALRELVRITRGRGLTVLFEHNPLNPLTRLAVARCEFDEDAELLGPRELRARLRSTGCAVVEQRYVIFFPWRRRALQRLEHLFRRLPLGAQYYVAAEPNGSAT